MSPYIAPGLIHEPADFIQSVCSETGIQLSVIRGKSRLREVVEVRQFIAYVLQAEFLMSQPTAGALINRDHATARYSRITFQANYQTDKNFRTKYDELCKKIGITIALKTVRDCAPGRTH
jgi:chromosomal replication initiation ATPase DnaA